MLINRKETYRWNNEMVKIPKVCYLYWGGGILSYLRYLTVYSFIKFNPGWEVHIYTPFIPGGSRHSWNSHEQKYEVLGADYFYKLQSLGAKIIKFDFTKIGIPCGISEVFKSDILRWHLLSTYGGFWSDFDIVYFRPMIDVLSKFGDFDTLTCWHEYCSIGFLMSSPNNSVFKWAKDSCMGHFDSSQYESVGCWLFMSKFKNFNNFRKNFPKNKIFNIPKSVVYPLDSNHIPQIYEGNHDYLFTGDTVGLHWYAGSKIAGEFQNMVGPESYKVLNNTLGSAIKRAVL